MCKKQNKTRTRATKANRNLKAETNNLVIKNRKLKLRIPEEKKRIDCGESTKKTLTAKNKDIRDFIRSANLVTYDRLAQSK